MSDLISRQAAIDALKRAEALTRAFGYHFVIDTIRELPSAQPERKKGKWIYGEDEYGIDGYHCDKCGFFVPWDYTHKFIDFIKDYHFCPNCGADMRLTERDSNVYYAAMAESMMRGEQDG